MIYTFQRVVFFYSTYQNHNMLTYKNIPILYRNKTYKNRKDKNHLSGF